MRGDLQHKFIALFSIGVLLSVLLMGCSGDDDPSTVTPAPIEATELVETDEPTAEATSTEIVTAEPVEVTPEATQEPTEEAPVVELMPNVSQDGDYSFTLVDITDSFSRDDVPEAREGQKWVLVRLAVTNGGGGSLTVEQDALTALDAQGGRYSPQMLPDNTLANLIGVEIPAGETLQGFTLFELPSNQQVVNVEWCPVADCDQPLTMPVP